MHGPDVPVQEVVGVRPPAVGAQRAVVVLAEVLLDLGHLVGREVALGAAQRVRVVGHEVVGRRVLVARPAQQGGKEQSQEGPFEPNETFGESPGSRSTGTTPLGQTNISS